MHAFIAGLYARVHSLGGRELRDSCAAQASADAPLGFGEVRTTPSGDLAARISVVHAVCPKLKRDRIETLVAACDAALAACAGSHTVAIPCLGHTDGGDISEVFAASTALIRARAWLESEVAADVKRVVFVAHTARQHEAFEKLMAIVFPSASA